MKPGRDAAAWILARFEFLALGSPVLVLVCLLFLLPLCNVLLLSVTEPSPGLGNYALLFTSQGIQRILLRTLRLSALTTAIAVPAAYLVAYVLAASSPRQRRLMLFFILVPFWVSALARAFSWLLLLGREGPLNTVLLRMGLIAQPLDLLFNEFGVTIAMVHYMLPYAILPLYTAIKDMDPQLVLASRGLGASPFGAFIHTFLPITLPAIGATCGLVFVYSLGFYIIPAILGGGRVLMVAQYISINVLDTVRWGVASMLAVTLLVTVLLLSASASQLGRVSAPAARA